jgi:hypothetical protein
MALGFIGNQEGHCKDVELPETGWKNEPVRTTHSTPIQAQVTIKLRERK